MKTNLKCIPCLLRATLQTLEATGMVAADPAKSERILKEALRITASEDWGKRPPIEVALRLNRLLQAETGVADPYREAKIASNRAALALLPRYATRLAAMPPGLPLLRAALALSAAGNVVDFACELKIDLSAALEGALAVPFAVDDSHLLYDALAKARSLFFFCDNSGEVAFDKLLLETIARLFPAIVDVAVVVKAAPLLNDVTLEDARAVGLDTLRFGPAGDAVPVRFIELGGPDLGAWPPSPNTPAGAVATTPFVSFPQVFQQTDVVLSKGQANIEALSNWHAGIFFLLTVKCEALAEELATPISSRVLCRI